MCESVLALEQVSAINRLMPLRVSWFCMYVTSYSSTNVGASIDPGFLSGRCSVTGSMVEKGKGARSTSTRSVSINMSY